MKFDIVFVTYNSQKWIDKCIESIAKSNYNLKNVSLLFCDNNSTDSTVDRIKEVKNKYNSLFNKIDYTVSFKNRGFGVGNNEAAKLGDSEYIFFLNVDTEIFPNTLAKIKDEINKSSSEFAIWELSQRPFEHPKYYNPLTGETSWSSGACFVIKRSVFSKIGGFDKNIFMYCEDVDLSWNVRKNGYKIKYLHNTPINHYSYESSNSFKYTQFVYGFISNWYLRSKYGKLRNFLRGFLYLFNTGFKGNNIPDFVSTNVKKQIKSCLRKEIYLHFIRNLFITIFSNKKAIGDFKPTFINGLDYELNKENPFFEFDDYVPKSLVSVIVRTCGRPNTLRETLISLRNQTYNNIEIIIVEDGKPISKKLIDDEFSDLNIVYHATGDKKGRSYVANYGMNIAKGKYINFLDDDDLFYPDHVELLLKYAEKNDYDVVNSGSIETAIDILSRDPYKYVVHNYTLWEAVKFNRSLLYNRNVYPIQSIMFKKSLLKDTGLIDENLDALEDWDFWVRLSLHHNFYRLKRTTSIFRTPAKPIIREERQKFLDDVLDYLEEKFKTYYPDKTVYDIKEDKKW